MLSFAQFQKLFDEQTNLQSFWWVPLCGLYGHDLRLSGYSGNPCILNLMIATLQGATVPPPENFSKYWPSIQWQYPQMYPSKAQRQWDSTCLICFDPFKLAYGLRCGSCTKRICVSCAKKSLANGLEIENCMDCKNPLMLADLKKQAWYKRWRRENGIQEIEVPREALEKILWVEENMSFVMCCDKPAPPSKMTGETIYRVYLCPLCSKQYCFSCLIHIPNGQVHECNDDDLSVARILKETTKPCPKCGVLIQKADGCNHMFCVKCKTCYCWATGDIMKTSSNPLYTLYRNQMMDAGLVDELPCGETLFVHSDKLANLSSLTILRTIREMESFVYSTHNPLDVYHIPRAHVNMRIAIPRLDAILRELIYMLYLIPLSTIWNKFVAIFESKLKWYPSKSTLVSEHYLYYIMSEILQPYCHLIWTQHVVGLKNVTCELKRQAFSLGLADKAVRMFLMRRELKSLCFYFENPSLDTKLREVSTYLSSGIRIFDMDECFECEVNPVDKMTEYELATLKLVRMHATKSPCLTRMYNRIIKLNLNVWDIYVDPCVYAGRKSTWYILKFGYGNFIYINKKSIVQEAVNKNSAENQSNVSENDIANFLKTLLFN